MQWWSHQTHTGNKILIMSVLITKPWPTYSDANVVSVLIEMKLRL